MCEVIGFSKKFYDIKIPNTKEWFFTQGSRCKMPLAFILQLFHGVVIALKGF